MASKTSYTYSADSLDARYNEARNTLIAKETDLYRLTLQTPSDADQSNVEAARAEAERVKAEFGKIAAEVEKRNSDS